MSVGLTLVYGCCASCTSRTPASSRWARSSAWWSPTRAAVSAWHRRRSRRGKHRGRTDLPPRLPARARPAGARPDDHLHRHSRNDGRQLSPDLRGYGLSFARNPYYQSTVELIGIKFTQAEIATVCVSLVLLGLFGLVAARTRLGLGWRATVIDPAMAASFGVDPVRVRYLNFIIGSRSARSPAC